MKMACTLSMKYLIFDPPVIVPKMDAIIKITRYPRKVNAFWHALRLCKDLCLEPDRVHQVPWNDIVHGILEELYTRAEPYLELYETYEPLFDLFETALLAMMGVVHMSSMFAYNDELYETLKHYLDLDMYVYTVSALGQAMIDSYASFLQRIITEGDRDNENYAPVLNKFDKWVRHNGANQKIIDEFIEVHANKFKQACSFKLASILEEYDGCI